MDAELPKVELHVPRWLVIIYAVFTITLVPWIIFLAYALPVRHLSRNWDIAWVGFDLAVLVLIALTAGLVYLKSGWVALTSMSVFTLLIADAWFDVLTARPGRQAMVALAMAVLVELPLAGLSFWLSLRTMHQLVYPGGRKRGRP
jgi:hypothetical protein